jgi:hypothetical protein
MAEQKDRGGPPAWPYYDNMNQLLRYDVAVNPRVSIVLRNYPNPFLQSEISAFKRARTEPGILPLLLVPPPSIAMGSHVKNTLAPIFMKRSDEGSFKSMKSDQISAIMDELEQNL